MTKKILFLVALIIIILIELGLQTIWLQDLNNFITPLIYLSLAVLYLFFGFKLSESTYSYSYPKNKIIFDIKYIHLFTLIIIGSIFYLSWNELNSIVLNNKIAPTNSDVIPSIELYVKRLLSGDKVYTILHFPGWDVAPTYLTMMWLPYIIPEILGMDYRAFSFVIFVVFILFMFFISVKKYYNQISTDIVFIFAAIMLYLLLKNDISVFSQSLELTMSVFYMILALTIMERNTLVVALGILLCLLSRYSLSFWLISYVLIILVSRGWKDFLKVNMYILLGVLILFIPFIIDNLKILIEGFEHYNKAAIGEWQVHSWQNPNDEPYQLSRGFGFAIYFYKLASGEVVERLKVLQKSHFIISFLSGIFVFILYYFNRKKIKNIKLYLIFGLKFFIMVFLIFIQVPYSYLFVVPLFLTVPILYELAKPEMDY